MRTVTERNDGAAGRRGFAERAASFLERRVDRRGVLRRGAMAGTALAVAPTAYVLRPGSAYAAVCAPGALCNDGYTEFCCTIYGDNQCPPGIAARRLVEGRRQRLLRRRPPLLHGLQRRLQRLRLRRQRHLQRRLLGHRLRLRPRRLQQPQGRAARTSATASATRVCRASGRSCAAWSPAPSRGGSTAPAPRRPAPTTAPATTPGRACEVDALGSVDAVTVVPGGVRVLGLGARPVHPRPAHHHQRLRLPPSRGGVPGGAVPSRRRGDLRQGERPRLRRVLPPLPR